jgi:hypothetical protein
MATLALAGMLLVIVTAATENNRKRAGVEPSKTCVASGELTTLALLLPRTLLLVLTLDAGQTDTGVEPNGVMTMLWVILTADRHRY